jgi:ribosomal protein S3AE
LLLVNVFLSFSDVTAQTERNRIAATEDFCTKDGEVATTATVAVTDNSSSAVEESWSGRKNTLLKN